MRVLELGSYVAPAYAGMVLAEQGHDVEKWTLADPIHDLKRGDELWQWINHGKMLRKIHAQMVSLLPAGEFDVVIDNVRAETWQHWGVDPAVEATRLGVTWVSLRADDDGRSFDVIAQARAWGDLGYVPFYLGDTAAGLWLAFKALAAPVGHHVIRQAACLAKLIEGELVVPVERDGSIPWDDPAAYRFDAERREAVVQFKGQTIVEPARGADWRAANLRHEGGRFII